MSKQLNVAEAAVAEIVHESDEIDGVENETREEKFLRIAERRTNEVLGRLALIEQMAGGGNYKFDRESVESMVATIQHAVDRLHQRFDLVLTRQNPTMARKSFRFGNKD